MSPQLLPVAPTDGMRETHFCKCNPRTALSSCRSALSRFTLRAFLCAAALSFNISVQQINSSSERAASEMRILAISPALFSREWLLQVCWTRRGKWANTPMEFWYMHTHACINSVRIGLFGDIWWFVLIVEIGLSMLYNLYFEKWETKSLQFFGSALTKLYWFWETRRFLEFMGVVELHNTLPVCE